MASALIATLGLNVSGWINGARKAQQSVANMSRSIQVNMRRIQVSARRASGSMRGLGNAAGFVQNRIIKAGLFFAGFYQGLIILRQVVGTVVSEFFNLDENLRKVQSISKSTDEEIKNLKTDLLAAAAAGETFGQKASEVADAMFEIVQSGFSLDEAFEIAQTAAIGAEAGFTDAATSGRVLVGVLNAFGRPASESREVMDVLFKTVDVGVVTFEELSRGLGRTLGPAASLGVTLEELGAIISVLTRRGLQGREAMTSLTRIMISFLKPSDKARKAAAGMGFELSAQKIATDGLIPSLIELNEKTGGHADSLGSVFDRQRAVIGAQLLLTDGGEELLELWDEHIIATDGVGAATEALNERQKALTFQLRKISVQLLALITGAIEPLNEALQKVLPQISNFIAGTGGAADAIKRWMPQIKGLAAALLVLSLTVIGPLAFKFLAFLIAQLLNAQLAMAKFASANVVLLLMAVALGALVASAEKLKDVNIKSTMDQFATSIGRVNANAERLAELQADGLINEDVAAQSRATTFMREFHASTISVINALKVAQTEGEGFMGNASINQRLTRGVSSWFTDWRNDSEKLRDELDETFDQMLIDSDLTVDNIDELQIALGLAFHQANLLGKETGDWEMSEIIKEANIKLERHKQLMIDTADAAEETAIAMGIIGESTGDIIRRADSLVKLFEGWESATEATEKAIKAIMDMTTVEGAEQNKAAAEIGVTIAVIQEEVNKITASISNYATENGILMDDYVDGTDSFIDGAKAALAIAEDRLEAEENNLTLITDQNIVLDARLVLAAATIDLTVAQKRAMEGLIFETTAEKLVALEILDAFESGPEALAETLLTIGDETEMTDGLLTLVETLIDTMDDGELKIDATNALHSIGATSTAIGNLYAKAAQGGSIAISAYLDSKGFTINSPGPPTGNQLGVRNFIGGMAVVGEAGPELIRLPRGVDVVPYGGISPAVRNATQSGAGKTVIETTVNVNAGLFSEWKVIKEQVLREVDEHLDDQAARAGLGRPRLAPFGAGTPRT